MYVHVYVDYNLTLGDLMGTIKKFFEKMGIEDVTFKPAYNPYTEPSMEVSFVFVFLHVYCCTFVHCYMCICNVCV